VTLIAANSDVGLLYGVFRYLALIQRRAPMTTLDIHEAPHLKLRVLDHWDNPDRSVERGYAGQSIWDFWRLPGFVDPRYRDYARADASVGINGVVINNVNASSVYLTPRWIAKLAALADVLRPYGIRVYSQSGLPLAPGIAAPQHSLAWYEAQVYRYAPGRSQPDPDHGVAH
jgi:alpha-glucuronidase